MNSAGRTRLLILSDLHAHSDTPDAAGATSLSFHGSAAGVDRLFDGLVATLSTSGLSGIDAVVCPGDLSNQCDSTALARIWQRLCDLADTLDAELVATAGNHDHARTGGEPSRFLKGLAPPFPVRNEDEAMRYFAYRYARIEVAGRTFIAVDSAAMTGLTGADGSAEHAHGRITQDTVDRIRTDLAKRPAQGTRVLVVHHHPVQLPLIDQNEASRIVDVELLLDLLAEDGSWVIVHGHKHRPWIQYAPGGGGSAVLFSAGSFAAGLDGVLAQSTKNQFYVLDLLGDDDAHGLGLGPAGTYRAWSHTPLEPTSWVPSGKNDGLPARGGFGWRADPFRLARSLADRAREVQADLTWNDLVAWEPRLAFLTPDDWSKTERHLARIERSLRVQRTAEGALERIAILEEMRP